MLDDCLVYLIILIAAGLVLRYIRRQTRPGADAACGCGECTGCTARTCPNRDAATPLKITVRRS